ncbi:MAG: stage V sporulation protein S [Chloroflexi bacterium]|nr:stage V sporulation protein S [Chloroflexota bacterium]
MIEEQKMIKVASASKTASVAGAIAHTMRESESGEVKVRAMGAGAVNQAIKAIALACKFLLDDDPPVSICCIPAFVDLELDGEEKTAIEMMLQRHEFVDSDDDLAN